MSDQKKTYPVMAAPATLSLFNRQMEWFSHADHEGWFELQLGCLTVRVHFATNVLLRRWSLTSFFPDFRESREYEDLGRVEATIEARVSALTRALKELLEIV